MIFKEISIGQLNEYINSENFKKSKVLPITRHRAISHINNPRADKNDISLILAIDNKDILGYIGFLPDKIYGKKEIKVAWNSCWWADSEKGNGVAMSLFYKALEVWNENLLFAELTPLTKTILEKTGFFYFPETNMGIRGFLRFNTKEILPEKKENFKKIIPVLSISDFVFNALHAPRLFYWKKKISTADYQLEYINEIDDETNSFIKKYHKHELIRRGAKELNWILEYPWVLSSAYKRDKESDKYYFSSLAGLFIYYCIKIFHNKKLIGFIILSQRDKHIKIPYCYFDKNNSSIIINVIYQVLINKKATTFTTFNPYLKNYILNNKTLFFYRREIPKYFAISKKLYKYYSESFNLQDGDGDCVFT